MEAEPPRKRIGDIVDDACRVIADAAVADAVADEHFAIAYGRLLVFIRRIERARATHPDVHVMRHRALPILRELHDQILLFHQARGIRRWPLEEDGAPSRAMAAEVSAALRVTSATAPTPMPSAADLPEAFGRWHCALRHMAHILDTVSFPHAPPEYFAEHAAARARLASSLESLATTWRETNDRLLFGDTEDIEDDNRFDVLMHLVYGVYPEERGPAPLPAPRTSGAGLGPPVHLGKLVADTFDVINDPEVPDAVADDTFARIHGRLLALTQRASRARTASRHLEQRRATLHHRLEEMSGVLIQCHLARCLRRWPQGDDGTPPPAFSAEVLLVLDRAARGDIVGEDTGELALETLGRSLGALRLMLLFFDSAQPATHANETIAAAGEQMADTLAQLERAWCLGNELAMFGEQPQDIDDDVSLALLLSLALDPEPPVDPSTAPN